MSVENVALCGDDNNDDDDVADDDDDGDDAATGAAGACCRTHNCICTDICMYGCVYHQWR